MLESNISPTDSHPLLMSPHSCILIVCLVFGSKPSTIPSITHPFDVSDMEQNRITPFNLLDFPVSIIETQLLPPNPKINLNKI